MKLKHQIMTFVLIAIAVPFFSGKLYAQPISDLSIQSFEEVIEEEQMKPPVNPFAGAGVSAAEDLTIEDLILAGTMTAPTRSYALISGYLVEVGDRIAGFQIDKIEKGKVVLRRLDEVYVLTMGGV